MNLNPIALILLAVTLALFFRVWVPWGERASGNLVGRETLSVLGRLRMHGPWVGIVFVASLVLLALGKIGDPRASEAVARDLYHDSPDVRAAAAEALAAMGTATQVEPLDGLKGDYYRKVRDGAELALARLSGTPSEVKK